MSFIVLLILFAVLGIGLGILFNKLVIKDYPDSVRKSSYVAAVFVFLIVSVLVFGTIYGRSFAETSIKNNSAEMEQYINASHSNLDFVRNGLNMTAIQNDISRLNTVFADLNIVLRPFAGELGIPRLIYNSAFDYAARQIQSRLAIESVGGNRAVSFTDENNMLTISSLLNGLQTSLINIVNIAALVIIIIIAILFAVYIIKSLSQASKARKARE